MSMLKPTTSKSRKYRDNLAYIPCRFSLTRPLYYVTDTIRLRHKQLYHQSESINSKRGPSSSSPSPLQTKNFCGSSVTNSRKHWVVIINTGMLLCKCCCIVPAALLKFENFVSKAVQFFPTSDGLLEQYLSLGAKGRTGWKELGPILLFILSGTMLFVILFFSDTLGYFLLYHTAHM